MIGLGRCRAKDLPVVKGRTLLLVIGLVVLAVVPLSFSVSWKRALAGAAVFLLAIGLVLIWWAMQEPRRRFPRVAVVLGVLGGLVLGGMGAGLYCQMTDCSAGFDALVLLPAGALLGAFVGGGIGYMVASRERGSYQGDPDATSPRKNAPGRP